MTRRAKPDAEARLDAAVDGVALSAARHDEYVRFQKAWRSYRRALHALLRERAEMAVEAARCGCDPLLDDWADFIRAAVLKGRKP